MSRSYFGRARRASAPPAAPTAAEAARAYDVQDYARARQILEALLERDPNWVDGQIFLAHLLYSQFGEFDRPESVLLSLLKRHPGHAKALSLISTIQLGAGMQEDAALNALRCMDAAPCVADAYLTLFRIQPHRGAEIAAEIERVLRDRQPNDRQRIVFHWTLGRILDAADEVDRAFAEFTAAQRLKGGAYDFQANERRVGNMIQAYDPLFARTAGRFGVNDARPVFIVGLPRSGSTLLERSLSRHPAVDTAGERADMFRLAEALRRIRGHPEPGQRRCCEYFRVLTKNEIRTAGNDYLTQARAALKHVEARRWIDKMPGNVALLGFIHQLLPKARMIHALRNPLDTALSCFTQSFESGHEYTQNLEWLAHYIALQRRYMAHWRRVLPTPILEVRYEDVVADLEREARRAIAHLELDWNAACLSPQASDRVVATASIEQVRRPIYSGSIGKWRRYERHLTPLLDLWREMGEETFDSLMAEVEDAPQP